MSLAFVPLVMSVALGQGAPPLDAKFIVLIVIVAVALLLIFRGSGARAAHMTRTCRNCGANHPGFARFCRKCGQKL